MGYSQPEEWLRYYELGEPKATTRVVLSMASANPTANTAKSQALRPKTRSIVTWTLSVLLAAMFLLSGSGKLANAATSYGNTWDEQFVAWGYPAWFRLVVGAGEVLGAIALLVPRVRFIGAAVLTGLMLGAVPTHLLNGEGFAATVPLVLGVLTFTVAALTRPAWVDGLVRNVRELVARKETTA
jgi:uncharacterized membrane protein YphA (DoxX/SURF4 family)